MTEQELLEHLYNNEQLTMREIASQLNLPYSTVNYKFKKYGIKARDFSIGELNRVNGLSDETKEKLRKAALERYQDKAKHPMTGKYHSSEAKVKMSKAGRGRNKRAHLSEWDGSHTAKSKLFYNSKTWQEIRTQVFERDDYTCQLTGKRGGDLECHHIMPRSKLVEDKWTDQTNLITLSKEAHRLSKGKEELLEKVLLDNLRSRGII